MLHQGRTFTPTQTILDVLDTRHAVAADDIVLWKAGKISGTLISRGEEIDREDWLIGATALLTDEPVVTRTSDHFERINGLRVETYRADSGERFAFSGSPQRPRRA